MKTSELIGPALDWAVAKCEGFEEHTYMRNTVIVKDVNGKCTGVQVPTNREYVRFAPSKNWAQGGPIIEREEITIKHVIPAMRDSIWQAHPSLSAKGAGGKWGIGPTPLIAAMRCYVASKLGNEVEIPKELM